MADFPPTHPHIQYWQAEDGALLCYREHGATKGQAHLTVVMLHSLFFDGSMFNAVLPYLPDNVRILCPDHRGQGRSESGTQAPTMVQLARDTAALVKQCSDTPVHLVGSSMGGYVALELAARHQALVASCVLSCCTAHAERQPERFAALEQALRDRGAAEMVPVLLQTMFGESFLSRDSVALAHWRDQFGERDARIADAVHGVFARPGYASDLAGMTMPMLLLSGGQDRAKRPEDMQYICDHVPHGRHQVIDEAGHTPPVETPQAYGRALSEFWQQSIL